MRILFLSHYFPPEVNAPASRTYEHCREWVKNGHEVTVVTCVPNHPKGSVYDGYRNKFFQWETRDGIRVLRVWTYLAANKGFLKRTLNYISYMVSVIFAVPLLCQSDIVISTSPQFFNGLAGYFVSRLKRIPWILEIRDLWPESILAVGAIKNKTVIRLLENLELFAYRKADLIVPVTKAFKIHIEGRGIRPKKIKVLVNGANLSFYKPLARENELSTEFGLSGKFVVSYFGTHGMAHGLETILEAAMELRDREEILFLLVGSGAEREKLLSIRDQAGQKNVLMLEQQKKERMPLLWAASDVSMVLLKRTDLFKTVIPSKIFESMAMEKPIILGVEGESAGIIQEAESGLCIQPQNSSDLGKAILFLYEHPEECIRLGTNGRKYVIEHHDRSVLAGRYEALVERVIRGGEG